MVFKEVAAAFDALAEHADEASELWTTRQRRDQLDRIETLARMLPALGHELINQLAADATGEELGGSLSHALANWLRITRHEAARRIHEAADLGARRALAGEALAPVLEATAAGQRRGMIGAEHVRVIRGFFHRLPGCVDEPTKDRAERRLAGLAGKFRPDELSRAAQRLELCLNPDGTFSDTDRARRRGINVASPRPRRDEPAVRLADTRAAGWLGGGDGQVGRAGGPGSGDPFFIEYMT